MSVDLIYDNVAGEKTYKRRHLNEIEGIMIHRVGKDRATGADFGDTAEEICKAFTEGPAAPYTGGKVPYTFIVEGIGRTAQTLPMTWVGPHALRHSLAWLSVAFVGDFRYDPLPDTQFVPGVLLVRALMGSLALGIWAVEGHDAVPGASKNKRKRCPGDKFDLYKFCSAITGGLAF